MGVLLDYSVRGGYDGECGCGDQDGQRLGLQSVTIVNRIDDGDLGRL